MTSSWKQLVCELKSLTKNNGINAWKTAGILRKLMQNEEFKTDAGSLMEAESRLAQYAGRFALGVQDLIEMINHFPDKEDWKDGRLDILRDKTAVILLKKSRPTSEYKPNRNGTRRQHAEFEYNPANVGKRPPRDKIERELGRVREEKAAEQKRRLELEQQLKQAATGECSECAMWKARYEEERAARKQLESQLRRLKRHFEKELAIA